MIPKFVDLLGNSLVELDSDLSGRWLAHRLDERDPLRQLRNEFHIPKLRTLPHGTFFCIKTIKNTYFSNSGQRLGCRYRG